MRYYSITLRDPNSGEVYRPKAFQRLNLPDSYTSYVNGKTLPGALNVEIQVQAYNQAAFRQGSFVRIWGVSLEELRSATNLYDFEITVKAGMQKGLPLANPAFAGVIIEGRVFQALGNWSGTDMTLDLMLIPPTGVGTKPLNFPFTWRQGSQLSEAIQSTLRTAMPDYTVKMAISPQLVATVTETGIYSRLDDFSSAVWKLSQLKQFQGISPQGGGPYPGVHMTVRGKEILVYDRTQDYGGATFNSPKEIKFQELIGQPTWISSTSINFKCAMRADMQVGDYVKLPEKLAPPYVLTSQGAGLPNTPSRDRTTFSGKFVIQEMFHFGNFRQADAASWVTSFNAVFVPLNTGQTYTGGAAP